ncbi:hypothetical protein C8R42DRAFT_647441 [Lentinula raphanica]|nr:hypothetical protein C8R42DRAFT_647441 [Lentinula raphanica]
MKKLYIDFLLRPSWFASMDFGNWFEMNDIPIITINLLSTLLQKGCNVLGTFKYPVQWQTFNLAARFKYNQNRYYVTDDTLKVYLKAIRVSLLCKNVISMFTDRLDMVESFMNIYIDLVEDVGAATWDKIRSNDVAVSLNDGAYVYVPHEKFNFPDANIYLKALDSPKIYGLYAGYLKQASDIFHATLQLPNKNGEGQSLENPIIVPVESLALDAFCGFLFQIEWKETSRRPTAELLALGELALVWHMPDALKFVIMRLTYRHTFNRATKLYYAYRFGVPNWGFDGAEEVLRSSLGLGGVNDEEMNRLLTQMAVYLAEGRNMKDDKEWMSCPQREQCEKALRKGWKEVGPAIAQIQGPVSLAAEKLKEVLDSLSPSWLAMRAECREALASRAEQVTNRIEEFVCTKAGERVSAWLKQEFPNAHEKEGSVLSG